MALISSFNLHLPFSKTKLHSGRSWQQHAELTTKISGIRVMVLLKPTESHPSIIPDHHGKEMKTVEETDSRKSMKRKSERRTLSNVWREIHGNHDWDGLLDPMDPLLRSELLKYGDLTQATYDAFESDSYSKNYGRCKFGPSEFFKTLEVKDDGYGYEIKSYLYATFNVNHPSFFIESPLPDVWSKYAWIGYVAVSDDETSRKIGRRDITIAWRGTITPLEWVADLRDFLRGAVSDKIPTPDRRVKVESGFLDLYTDKNESSNSMKTKTSAREQVISVVERLIETYAHEEMSITLTGHSLGSALATLCAFDLKESIPGLSQEGRVVPVCVYSFSGPRVGNLRFRKRLEKLGVKVLRVVNVHDVVPKSPGFLVNEHVPFLMNLLEPLPWTYSHLGVELALNDENSPFLKHEVDAACWHNLEGLLHLVAGYHGKGKKFELVGRRDPALVNKSSNFLKDELCIPPNWKQDKNKGLVKNKHGYLMQPLLPQDDDQ